MALWFFSLKRSENACGSNEFGRIILIGSKYLPSPIRKHARNLWNDIEKYQKAMTWSRGWLHWLPAFKIDLNRRLIISHDGKWKIIFKPIDTLLFRLRYHNKRQSSWIIILRSFCHGQSNSCSSGNMTLKGMASYLFAFDLSMKPIWIDAEDEYRTLTHTHTKCIFN